MNKTKDIVVGLGEIGFPIYKLLSRNMPTLGYDIDTKKINKTEFNKLIKLPTTFLHICIPFSQNFLADIMTLYKKFSPKGIVVHSTIEPYTTKKIQDKIPVPIIYSATRGVHARMLFDLKRYVKFYATEQNAPNKQWASRYFSLTMKKCGIKTKKISKPITLELAKILCDTSYYGWLITYAQITKMIADKHDVNYDEMWTFSDEIHKYLGNRPKMFPGFIGGHCVIPNLKLIDNRLLNLINDINLDFAKHLN